MSRIARLGCVPLVLGLAVSGCDIGVDFWQNASVQVDVPAKVPKTFSTTQDLNLGGSSARLPVGNLDSVQIPEITIDISDVGSGNLATLISGSLVITDPADSTFTPVTLPFDNVAVVDDGQATIVPSAAEVADLQTPILGKNDLQIVYNATVDAVPAQFQLTASIHLVAEVGP